MIDALQGFVESLPTLIQWLGVMLIGAIPFVESQPDHLRHHGGLRRIKRSVMTWQAVAIPLWGVAFGILTLVGVDLLARRAVR